MTTNIPLMGACRLGSKHKLLQSNRIWFAYATPSETLQLIMIKSGRSLDAGEVTKAKGLLGTDGIASEPKEGFRQQFEVYKKLIPVFDSDNASGQFASTVAIRYRKGINFEDAMLNAILDSVPWISAVEYPADHLCLRFGRRLTQEQLAALTKATGTDLGRVGKRLDSHMIIRLGSDADFKTTLKFHTTAGQIILSPEKATVEQLKKIVGESRVIIDERSMPDDASFYLADMLRRADVKSIEYNDFLNEEKRKAFTIARVRRMEVPEGIVLRHVHAVDESKVEVTCVRLKPDSGDSKGIGDAFVVRCSDKKGERLLLIDTGLDQKGYEEIKRRLPKPKEKDKPVSIDIVITHEDKDHIAGLRKFLEDPSVRVEQVMLGALAFNSPIVKELLDRHLNEKNGWITQLDLPHFLQFVRKEKLADRPEPLKIKEIPQDDRRFKVFSVSPSEQVRIDILQFQEPNTPNQSALVVKLHHRGMSQLLTSDIDTRVIKEMLTAEDFTKPFDLRADFLKWPHHVSFPQSFGPHEREVMADFLKQVNPHTVLFSNVGIKQDKAMKDKAVEFIKAVLGDDVQILWTLEDGTIQIITRRNNLLPGALLTYECIRQPSTFCLRLIHSEGAVARAA